MKLIVQNLATEYRDEGNGSSSAPLSGASADKPVLLFLHGWGDSSRTFDLLMPFLSGGQRIIRLDLPGFGASEPPPAAWNLDDYISFVQAFISKLNLRVDALIGHSFGGRIIIKWLGNYSIIRHCEGEARSNLRERQRDCFVAPPPRGGGAPRNDKESAVCDDNELPAQKIILIAPAGLSFRSPLRITFFWLLAKISKIALFFPPFNFLIKKSLRWFYQWLGSDYFNAGVLRETFLKIIGEDLGGVAERINIPTLLIWGADDADTPLADGQRLRELIRGSRLEIISGADHMVHQEKPREVARLIRDFCKRLLRRGSQRR